MSLVAGVVHREHGVHLPVVRLPREVRAEEDGRQRRVPVVRVEDERRRRDLRERGERRLGEERVATRVVLVVASVLSVNAIAIE